MELDKIYVVCKGLSLLEALKEISETKLTYDYMECLALEKVSKDISSGREVDWTAVRNVEHLTDELLERLNRLLEGSEDFLEDLLKIV